MPQLTESQLQAIFGADRVHLGYLDSACGQDVLAHCQARGLAVLSLEAVELGPDGVVSRPEHDADFGPQATRPWADFQAFSFERSRRVLAGLPAGLHLEWELVDRGEYEDLRRRDRDA